MLYTHSTEKLLGLKGVIVKNVKQTPEITEIHLEMKAKPHTAFFSAEYSPEVELPYKLTITKSVRASLSTARFWRRPST